MLSRPGSPRRGVWTATIFGASAERGTLVDVGRGVDRLRDHPFDWAARSQAALDLAGPEAVLGPRPSARLYECYHVPKL